MSNSSIFSALPKPTNKIFSIFSALGERMKRKSPIFPLKEPDFKALMIDPPIKELTCFAEAVNSLPSKTPKTRVPEDSFEKDFDINCIFIKKQC